MYDVIIVGGGPGGVAAGIYAARKRLRTLVISESFTGQSVVSEEIHNWIGSVSISGMGLAEALETHLRSQDGIDIMDGEWVEHIEKKSDETFLLHTKSGKEFSSKTILITSGSRRKKLGIPGEKEFEGKGVFYCAICDAPLFKEKAVAVIGGGNSALEAVIDLEKYASKIYLLHHREELKGDKTTQEKIQKFSNVEFVMQAEIQEIRGGALVEGISYIDIPTNIKKEIKLDGVFVEIGAMPNSDFVRTLVEVNPYGAIVVDPRTQKTSCKGVWAAGDVTAEPYRQNNISAGDAIKAILNIYDTLHGVGA